MYTITDKTVTDDTGQYKAYVDPVTLYYTTYIKINASDGITNTFTLSGLLQYIAPSGAGTIKVCGHGSSEEDWTDIGGAITIYDAEASQETTVDSDKLVKGHMYLLKIEISIEGGESNLFGSYSDLAGVKAATAAFDNKTPELHIQLSAQENEQTGNQ